MTALIALTSSLTPARAQQGQGIVLLRDAGIGAMAAGSGDAGTAILASSETIAQENAIAFTRVQEASADQAAGRFLLASHQSGKGLLTFFERFANEEAMSYFQIPPYLEDHPAPPDRIAALKDEVEKSPYYDKEDPQSEIDKLKLIKAKIYGFLDRTDAGFRRFPASDKSAPARYARSVLYFRDARARSSPREPFPTIAQPIYCKSQRFPVAAAAAVNWTKGEMHYA